MKLRILWGILPAVLLMAACSGGKTVVESDLGIRGAPDWVNEGSQALNDRDGRLIHGVGQSPALGDASLQLSTADNRARAELARILGTYVDLAASDYLATSSAGDQRETQQSISQQIRNTTQLNLSGAKIIGRWKDKRTGTVYALAELDMKQVKESLAVTQAMNEDLRRHLAAQSDNIFDRMAREKR